MNYSDYVDEIYPYTEVDTHFTDAQRAEIRAFNSAQKKVSGVDVLQWCFGPALAPH